MSSKKPVVCSKSFKLIDFCIYNEKKQEKEKETNFMIQMFGVNETGETCSIIVNDFKPFFYVKVGDNWTDTDARALYRDLFKRLGDYYGASLLSCDLVEHKKLYGYTAGKLYKFVKIVFDNATVMNKVKRYWYNEHNSMIKFKFKGINLELYESSIPPLLRYFHINNISPSGWIQIFTKKATVPAELTTTCDYEFVCPSSSIKSLPEKETRVPYKICSFDIEASSSHGDFPIPVKTYKRLASNIIDIFQKHSPDASRAKSLIERIVLTSFGYDHFEGADLVYPKRQKPSKELVVQLIARLMTTAIKDAEKMKEKNKNKNLISTMFERDDVDDIVDDDEIVDEDGGDSDAEDDDDEPTTY